MTKTTSSTSEPKNIPMLVKFCPGQVTGAPVMTPCSLPNAIKLPVNVRKPRNTSRPSARASDDVEMDAVRIVLGDADQRRRQAAERVRERDSLGHLGHRDARDGGADDRADDEAGDDPVVGDDLLVEERADDGDQHADDADEDAAPRALRASSAPAGPG